MAELCGPLANVLDMCCIDSVECPPDDTTTTLRSRAQPWVDNPGQPIDSYLVTPEPAGGPENLYSADEYAWLLLAERQLLAASQRLLRRTCGINPGPCVERFRDTSCCSCGHLMCECGTTCMQLPTVCGVITNVVFRVWTTTQAAPDVTLELGTDFFLDQQPGHPQRICLFEDKGPWPENHFALPLGTAGTAELVITRGEPVELSIVEAVADDACVKMNRCLPLEKCADYVIPDHTRQVGNVTLITILEYQEKGLTGIRSLDEVLIDYSCARYGYAFSDPAEDVSPFTSNGAVTALP